VISRELKKEKVGRITNYWKAKEKVRERNYGKRKKTTENLFDEKKILLLVSAMKWRKNTKLQSNFLTLVRQRLS